MNFIIIVSDTFRRDHLGRYGNAWISASRIDAFSSRALVFDRAYSGSFPTVPHRRDLVSFLKEIHTAGDIVEAWSAPVE